MKKRIVSAFCAVALAVGMVGAPIADSGFSLGSAITASAAKYGDFIYSVEDSGTICIQEYTGKSQNVTVPATIGGKKVTTLYSDLFFGRTEIKYVSLPDSISILPIGLFSDCTSLEKVDMPNNLTWIQEMVFYNCTSLKNITIPQGVTTINLAAFQHSGLTSVYLPSSVTAIAPNAFCDCLNLKSVTWIDKNIDNEGMSPYNQPAFGFHYEEKSGMVKDTGVTFYGCAGGYLEGFAKNNGFTWKAIESDNNPSNVYGLLSARGRNGIKLTWKEIYNATGYAVFIYNPTTKKYENYGVSKTNSIMVSGLTSGTTYLFALKAYTTVGGKNYWSNSWSFFSDSTLPENVTGIKAAKTGMTAINLSWNKVNGAKGYVVYKYVPGKGFQRYAVTKNNSQMITGLTSGTSYYFTVRAYRQYMEEFLYSPGYNKYLTTTLPTNVSFAVASTAKGSAYVKWNKVAGATGYVVYYRTAGGSWNVGGVVNANTNSFTKTGLNSGTAYAFTVRAYRTVGGKNYYSNYTQRGVTVR